MGYMENQFMASYKLGFIMGQYGWKSEYRGNS
jgi:hypothetical protein